MPADVARLAELGREGVLLLCGDSTNADRAGMAAVGVERRARISRRPSRAARGRIVVTCFASNIHRVQQVVDAAAALGRKVALRRPLDAQEREHRPRASATSRSPTGCSSGRKEIEDFPDHKMVVISTGSQGEPLSALRRMAHGDHPHVELPARATR